MSLIVLAPQLIHSQLFEAFSRHPYDLSAIIDPQHDGIPTHQVTHVWVIHHPTLLPMPTLNLQFGADVRLFEEDLSEKEDWGTAQWDDHLGGYGFFFPKKNHSNSAPSAPALASPPSHHTDASSNSSAKSTSLAQADFNWGDMKLLDDEEHQTQIQQQMAAPAQKSSAPIAAPALDTSLRFEGQSADELIPPVTAPTPISGSPGSSNLESATTDAPVEATDPSYLGHSYAAGPFILVHGKIGGPHGVRQFLRQLPAHLNCPVLIYQDVQPHQQKGFLEQMKKICILPVEWIQPETSLQAGRVYLCQNEHQIQLYGDEYYVIEGPQRSSPQEEIELLAEQQGILVLLSGLPLTLLMPCIQAINQGVKVIAPIDEELLDPQLQQQLDGYGLERVEHYTSLLLEQFPQDPPSLAA